MPEKQTKIAARQYNTRIYKLFQLFKCLWLLKQFKP